MAHGVTNERTRMEGGREGGKQQVGEELANPHHAQWPTMWTNPDLCWVLRFLPNSFFVST